MQRLRWQEVATARLNKHDLDPASISNETTPSLQSSLWDLDFNNDRVQNGFCVQGVLFAVRAIRKCSVGRDGVLVS